MENSQYMYPYVLVLKLPTSVGLIRRNSIYSKYELWHSLWKTYLGFSCDNIVEKKMQSITNEQQHTI